MMTRKEVTAVLSDVETFYLGEFDAPYCFLCVAADVVQFGYKHIPEHVGWYWRFYNSIPPEVGSDGVCHPDCGPVTMSDGEDGMHKHTHSLDGVCWHEHEPTYGEPNGPFATEAEAIEDATCSDASCARHSDYGGSMPHADGLAADDEDECGDER